MIFKAQHLREVTNFLRENSRMSSKEFEEYLSYYVDVQEREVLYKNFTDGEGLFHVERMNSDDKAVLNNLSSKIARYEVKLSKTPVFDELAKKHPHVFDDSGMPEFLRDSKGKWVKEATLAVKGWYQNSKGDLFHYDGIVWDNVPGESIKDLEFLGD